MASGLCRRDDLADAAFRVPSQQRHDVLAHPRSANLACDPGGVFRTLEHEDEDEVPVVDFGDVSGTATSVKDTPRDVRTPFDNLLGNWITQMKMVHDDVHEPTLPGFRNDRVRALPR